MRNTTYLIAIGLITLLAVFVVKRPDLVSNFWYYIVGLAGPIWLIIRRISTEIGVFLEKLNKK